MEEIQVPIRISGLSGGGLPPNLVDQVIEAERTPIKKMQEDKTKIEDKVKLVGDFESKINDIIKNLSSVIGARGFSDMKFVSGFPDILDGTVDPAVAESGDWTLEVTQLATKPSVISTGVADKDQTSIGVGYIKFDTPQGEQEVYISQDESTLEKVAAKINASNVGVRATIINDRKDKEESFKLQLTGAQTGDDNEIIFPKVYMVDGDVDFAFADKLAAQNAKFKVNGHEIESATNKVTDVIPGVAIDLKQARPGTPVKLTVTENYDAIGDKMKSFVDAYNAALGFIQNQNKLTNDKSGNPKLGPLGGDSMLRMTESRLRNIIQDRQLTNSSISRVIELGIEFNRNGTLNYSADKFKKAVSSNPKNVIEFLRGNLIDTGFITSMKSKLREVVDPQSGSVGARKSNMQKQVSNIDEKIQRKEKQLEKREETLRRQFSQMEETMAKMQAQGQQIGKG